MTMKRLVKISAMALLVMLAMTGCKKSYTITVKSNNAEWGTVTGSGSYKHGETATISAIPAAWSIILLRSVPCKNDLHHAEDDRFSHYKVDQ